MAIFFHFRRRLPGWSAVILILTAVGLRAQDATFTNKGGNGSLVELYTSEGCSSCPPAEAWMNRLKDSPRLWKDVFPVNFHVDYWDGLGWKDRFASPVFTERQRNYAARLGQESVYTPEFVTDGRENRSWFRGQQSQTGAEKKGELTVTWRDGAATARYVPEAGDSATGLTLNVALVGVDLKSAVQAGENDGHELLHDFIVLGFGSSAWPAGKTEVLTAIRPIQADKPAGLVAWISAKDGTIVQVAGGWLGH